jgi:hypothetical protein
METKGRELAVTGCDLNCMNSIMGASSSFSEHVIEMNINRYRCRSASRDSSHVSSSEMYMQGKHG